MRVLHVVSRDQRRGAETVALELAAALEGAAVVNRVVALAPAATPSARAGIEVLDERATLGMIGLPRRQARLRALVAGWRPDVIVAHGGDPALHAVAARLSTPVVWHRILELPALGRARSMLWRSVARRVDAAVAITDHLDHELVQLGFDGPVLRVPNTRDAARFEGVDHDVEGRLLRDVLGVEPQASLIGFVGHLVAQKDPVAAVEVLALVRRAQPGAHLVICGDGPLRPQVERAVRQHDLGPFVHLLGHRDDVPQILAALDLLVVTSRTESMTGTVIEAQMARCPVVAFPLDGMEGAIGEGRGGVVLPAPAVDAMARVIVDLIGAPDELAELRERAAVNGQRFTTQRHAGSYLDLFSRLATRSPRVLFVMPDIGVGGAEQALALIARHADHERVDVRVATLRSPRRPVEETVLPELDQLTGGVTSLELSGRADRSPVALVEGVLRLRRHVTRLGVDLVDSCLFEADLVTRLALVGTGTRHVVHLVSTPYTRSVDPAADPRRPGRLRVVQLVDLLTARLTDRFVAITTTVRDAAVRDLRLRTDKVVVIPRGVDLERFAAMQQPEDDPLRVLCVGRLVASKAHEVAIHAVARAQVEGADVRLSIVGEGPAQLDLERLITSLGLGGRIDLLPPTRDVPALHRAHHVFAFPSRWEGMGNALLEAMACGRPIVVSDLPVLHEVAGEVARFHPVGDADALAQQLVTLARLGSVGREAEGAACRRHVELHYDAARRVDELVACYAELLGLG